MSHTHSPHRKLKRASRWHCGRSSLHRHQPVQAAAHTDDEGGAIERVVVTYHVPQTLSAQQEEEAEVHGRW
jgi:hypothetical protein